MGLFDENDQLYVIDHESEAMIMSDDLSLIIEGDTKSIADKGVYTFSNIEITGKPLYNT